MPAFGDSYRTNNPYQQRNLYQQQQQQQSQQLQNQHPQFTYPQSSISPPDVTSSYSSPAAAGNSFGGSGAAQLSTVPGVGSGVGGNIKHRIYPKELSSHSVFKSPSNTGASPLLSAFSNPGELWSRSFGLSSSPGTGSSNHSSVAGSPPSSWPASYSNNPALSRGIGGSVPQQRGNGAYPSFEEHLSRNGGLLHQQRMANAAGVPGNERSLTPGEGGYVCAMDSLDGESENVLCLGWEGGLDIWRVGKGSLDLLGRLEGLSGGVKGAKILPTPQRSDPLASVRPLIALTLHSPIYTPSQDLPSPASSPATSRPASAASYTSSRSHHTNHSTQQKHVQEIEWQTSVELYSLSTRERVAVLFTGPTVPSPNIGIGETLQCPPPAWGNIKVEVGDRTVAVGLGLSGEVYLFSLISVTHPSELEPSPPPPPVVLAEVAGGSGGVGGGGSGGGGGGKKGKKNKGGSAGIPIKMPSASPPPPPKPDTVRGEWVLQAKVWTTVQVSTTGSFSSDNGVPFGGLGNTGIGFYQNGTPVFSLQGRWLAYAPPPANSSVSALGTARVPVGIAAHSIMSQAPSTPPSISATCFNADGEEKFINRMAREGTQEVIRVAKWVGETGKKAFQNYWNGNSGQGSSGTLGTVGSFPDSAPGSLGNSFGGIGGHVMNRGYSGGGMSGLGQQIQTERQLQQMAGYTGPMGSPYLSGNGNPVQAYPSGGAHNVSPGLGPQNNPLQQQAGGHLRSAMHGPNDPILVSILDIGRFPKEINSMHSFSAYTGYQLSPFVTIHPPLGVSYVSLAPGGLALLTASSKGDVYYVWDLKRVVHQKPVNPALGPSSNPGNSAISNRHVRQIARFSRMTVAHTVDVVWSHPRGDKVAILTDKGTAHFYDLPSDAYQWPPPVKPPPISASAGTSPVFSAQQQAAAGAVQAVQGAVSLLNSSAQPLLTAARRKSSNSGGKGPSPTGGISVNYSNASAARARDRESGADRRNRGPYGVDKISLPGTSGPVTPGSMKFLIGKELGHVGLIGGGSLVVYQKNSGGQGGSKKRRSMTGGGILPESGLMYELPGLPEGSPKINKSTAEEDLIEIEKVERVQLGFWNGRTHHHHHQRHTSTSPPDEVYRKRDEQQQYMQHPLSLAEIETNPAYPPFHTDRRVRLMVYADTEGNNPTTTGSVLLHQTQQPVLQYWDTIHEDNPTDKNTQWVYGLPIQVEKLNIGGGKGEVEFKEEGALEDVADAMESRMRVLMKQGEGDEVPERVILTTRKKKKKGKNKASLGGEDDGEGIFEDDCEVLDFEPPPGYRVVIA